MDRRGDRDGAARVRRVAATAPCRRRRPRPDCGRRRSAGGTTGLPSKSVTTYVGSPGAGPQHLSRRAGRRAPGCRRSEGLGEVGTASRAALAQRRPGARAHVPVVDGERPVEVGDSVVGPSLVVDVQWSGRLVRRARRGAPRPACRRVPRRRSRGGSPSATSRPQVVERPGPAVDGTRQVVARRWRPAGADDPSPGCHSTRPHGRGMAVKPADVQGEHAGAGSAGCRRVGRPTSGPPRSPTTTDSLVWSTSSPRLAGRRLAVPRRSARSRPSVGSRPRALRAPRRQPPRRVGHGEPAPRRW